MAQTQHTPALASLEEAIMVLFRVVDDTYALLNPRGLRHEFLKRLSDTEILTLGGNAGEDAGRAGDEDRAKICAYTTSTGLWVVRKGALRGFGREILATPI